MCGRFTHKFTWKELHDLLSRGEWPARLSEVGGGGDGTGGGGGRASLFDARYNVAPTQAAPVVRAVASAGEAVGVEVAPLRWGLIPSWSKEPKVGPINARAETVATNGVFRAAFASRRCIVPVSGFYEWKRTTSPALLPGAEPIEGPKRPHLIFRADGEPLLLAGVWERWGRGDACVETFAIITTTANTFMAQVHDRMPAVIEPEAAWRWLDPAAPADRLPPMLAPAPDGVLAMHEVSTRVNSPRNQGPELAERVAI